MNQESIDKGNLSAVKKRSGCGRAVGIGLKSVVILLIIAFTGYLGVTRIGILGKDNFGPVWSPDGKQIAFSSDRSGDQDIFVMNADGTQVTQLTWDPWKWFYFHANPRDWEPSWSPDGSQIAFVSGRTNRFINFVDFRIFTVNAKEKKITSFPMAFQSPTEYTPSWSPDGKKIAYAGVARVLVNDSLKEKPYSIYIMSFDGSGSSDLTPNRMVSGWKPEWSPDGKKIVFTSWEVGGTADLFIMNADGSDLVRFTTAISNEDEADWSPDGKQIAFVSDRLGKSGIFVINVDGSSERLITNLSSNCSSPDWSPDGSRIVYVSDRDGHSDIYVMNSDGTNIIKLTGK